jgi:two-component system, chemotaxis family, protein-glutamate methylesterase/glutaminase
LPEQIKQRVFIVDDAVIMRKTLSDAILQDPALDVAGTAGNGRLALSKFPLLKPDIVVLDIEMPDFDGLETVRALRKINPHVPIILFSLMTERAAADTLEALTLGATDYVNKPSTSDVTAALQVISTELIPKIRALCHLPERQSIAREPPPLIAVPLRISPAPRLYSPVQVVAIGVSTGGPEALAQLMPSLPANLSVPVVIAQHMPTAFTSLLAARLSEKSPLPVRECASGEALVPGCAILAPGDFHMVVYKEEDIVRLRLHQGAKENFCRPSVDVLFRSIAEVYGTRALAVILTGMGQDGLKGSHALRSVGARIYVQDEASSVVWGMPGFVARAGLADKVIPLDQIAEEIVRATKMQLAART